MNVRIATIVVLALGMVLLGSRVWAQEATPQALGSNTISNQGKRKQAYSTRKGGSCSEDG